MDRESLLSGCNEYSCDDLVKVEAVKIVINMVYDDIESRTCDNCKYFIDTFCTNEELDYVFTEWWKMPKDFGCNKFERK